MSTMTQVRHESGSGDAIKQATHPAVVISGVERILRTGVEAIASVLVLVEILVLFVGVAARFGFHDPIVWSDELASILFLWLAMFGSVVALQRDEHMALRATTRRKLREGEKRAVKSPLLPIKKRQASSNVRRKSCVSLRH